MLLNSLFNIINSFIISNIYYNKKYTFTCYNKKKGIISSYGYGYNPMKDEVFDARTQSEVKLPKDCSLFNIEE